MALRDLDEVLGEDFLELPVGGTTYRVKGVDAETGLYCERVFSDVVRTVSGQGGTGSLLLDDEQEDSLYRRVLGDTYDEMTGGGVTYSRIKFCAMTVVMWVVFGREYAERYWERGGAEGEAEAPNRATRRASKATATSSRRRGSTAGTTTPPRKAATG